MVERISPLLRFILRDGWRLFTLVICSCISLAVLAGCASRAMPLPDGNLPATSASADALLPVSFNQPIAQPPDALPKKNNVFDLPPGIPGSEPGNAALLEKNAYPSLAAVTERDKLTGEPLTLTKLQEMASERSPQLRKAQADAEAAYGAMIQAGLYPNPTVGYQADQMQPWLSPRGTPGQHGAFYNQLIKTAGKLDLAQQVAGYDYLNALVAARRTQFDVMFQVRSHYFAALVAQQSVEINRSLVTLADEVYELQRRHVRAGEAAAYEPLQLYAQAIQARNNLVQAQQTSRAAWKQLAASLGQPTLAPQPLAGTAEVPPPDFDFIVLEQQLADHTDMLTASNRQLQAQSNLRLQQVTPFPDVSTNTYVQYDNLAGTTQFGVQLGIALPLFDRNQGNIRQAQSTIVSTGEQINSTRNELISSLAEARSRYETSRTLANNYRNLILPNLSKAYRALIRRYQVEPDKVQFNDIVVAQQNLAQALQSYLTSLDGQWKATVDVANTVQLDELYPKPSTPPVGPSTAPAPSSPLQPSKDPR